MSQVPAVPNAVSSLEAGIASNKQEVAREPTNGSDFGDMFKSASSTIVDSKPSSAISGASPNVEVKNNPSKQGVMSGSENAPDVDDSAEYAPGAVVRATPPSIMPMAALAETTGDLHAGSDHMAATGDEPLPSSGNDLPLPYSTLAKATSASGSVPLVKVVAVDTVGTGALGRNEVMPTSEAGAAQGLTSSRRPSTAPAPEFVRGEVLAEPPQREMVTAGPHRAANEIAPHVIAPALKPEATHSVTNFTEIRHTAVESLRPLEIGSLEGRDNGRLIERLAEFTGTATNLSTSTLSSTTESGLFPSPLTPESAVSRPLQGVLSASVGTAEFTQEVSQRVAWIARQDGGSARLELNPADLGPISVKVTVQGDQAQIVLNAQHALTRDALEHSAERLREALGEEGFAQVDVDVGSREHSEEQAQSTHRESDADLLSKELSQGELAEEVTVSSHSGLVDRYV